MAKSFQNAQYLLSGALDEAEHERLTTQHAFLRKLFDNRLIFAPVSLRVGDEVLDCGTGTGIWALDVAEEHPTTIQYTGIDIDGRLFPSKRPPNVHFSLESVTDLPETWSDRFAFVHQRFLISGLTLTGWATALDEMHRVTRPGGFVQLCEVGKVVGTHSHMARVYGVVERFYAAMGKTVDPPRVLPELIARAGFIGIQAERRTVGLGSWAGPDGERMRDSLCGVFRVLGKPIMEAGGFGVKNAEEYAELMDNVVKELDEKPGTTQEVWMFYAQKL